MGDELADIYYELLADAGIAVERPTVESQSSNVHTSPLQCCSSPCIIHGARGEYPYCYYCGKCVVERVYEADFTRIRSSVMIERKRFYDPLTHFKEHIRRYMGARFTNIAQSILDSTSDIDVDDPNAYFLVKAKLKELKQSRLYKEIFTIIYHHGGHRPNIDDDMYNQCIEEFRQLKQRFMSRRGEYSRHSMPSMYMLLDLILHRVGHYPYYRIPYLQNEECRKRVLEIYSDLNINVD